MAGDWIKIEKVTATKPEVLMLAATLEVSTNEALGLCVRFWSWCDDHLLTGHDVRVTTNMLDVVLGHAGFARALISVGWLCDDNGSLEVPNFERHLSDSAKNRALSTRKKQHQRAQAVPKVSRISGDKSGTREEKRKEEKRLREDNTPLTPHADAGGKVSVVSHSLTGFPADDRAHPNPHDSSDTSTRALRLARQPPFDAQMIKLPSALDDAGFRAAWASWVVERKARRKPLTELAARAQLDQLAAHGPQFATAAIQRSIASGWTGLFPDQERKSQQEHQYGRTPRPRTIAFGPGQVTPGDEDPFKRPPRPLCDRPGYSPQAPAAT